MLPWQLPNISGIREYIRSSSWMISLPMPNSTVNSRSWPGVSREVNKKLTAFLSQYTKLQNLSHFGQELTDDVKKNLRLGEMVYKFFNQPYRITVPVISQLIILSMILQDMIESKEMLEKVKN